MPRSDDTREVRLTEAQRQYLSIALAHLDDALAELEHLASAPVRPSPLTTESQDLPEGYGAAITRDLGLARDRLQHLARVLRLEPRPRSRAREVQGLLAITLVEAEEAESARLGGYGSVDRGLSTLLDPALADVRAALTRMAMGLHPARGGRAGEGP